MGYFFLKAVSTPFKKMQRAFVGYEHDSVFAFDGNRGGVHILRGGADLIKLDFLQEFMGVCVKIIKGHDAVGGFGKQQKLAFVPEDHTYDI